MGKKKRDKARRDEAETRDSPADELRADEALEESPAPSAEAEDDVFSAEEIELSEEALDLVRRLEQERDEAVAARQRALADFVNFQRRARENEVRAARDGVADVVRSLLGALDHFDLALRQDMAGTTAEQIFEGVRLVREELAQALRRHNVETIEPAVGEEFNPNLHEAMMRQPAEDVAPNHIVSVMQPGYRMGGVILRPAKVAVAPAEDEE
jgi:molecular chaperone GrpE